MKLLIIYLFLTLALAAQVPEFLKNYNQEKLDPIKYFELVNHRHCNKNLHFKGNKISSTDNFIPIQKRPYDIDSMRLTMNWANALFDNNSRTWSGVQNITFDIIDATYTSIDLDAVNFEIESINLNGNDINDYLYDGKTISLLKSSDIRTLDNDLIINYRFVSDENRGFYLYHADEALHPIAYTMSQPENARYWMPCNDYPYEKQFSSITIIAPNEFTVASNGQLIEKETNDISTTWKWQHDYPISSYLMVANASIYKSWFEKVKRVENPTDSIDLSYYVWEEDYTNENNDFETYNARKTFEIIPTMMDTLTHYFGTYPFKKFGSVAVEPFWAGGMEHQSLQTVNRRWLDGSPIGISHELAHMWIGDLVTCASWPDIWLNEGGAVFGSIFYTEKVWGNPWKDYEKIANRDGYLRSGGLSLSPCYLGEVDYIFEGQYLPVIYSKAGLVYNMLRNLIGEKEFFIIMKDYFDEFAFSSASTEDFKKFLKENAPNHNIEKFFEQWVYGSGHPVYNLDVNRYQDEEGNFKLDLNLEQIQAQISPRDDITEVFDVPLRIKIKNGDMEDSIYIRNNEINQSFSIETKFFASEIEIDENFTLFEVQQSLSRELNTNIDNKITIYPNFLQTNDSFTIESGISIIERIEIVNLLGNTVIDKSQIKANKVTLNSLLTSGKYFVRITLESGKIMQKGLIIL